MLYIKFEEQNMLILMKGVKKDLVSILNQLFTSSYFANGEPSIFLLLIILLHKL